MVSARLNVANRMALMGWTPLLPGIQAPERWSSLTGQQEKEVEVALLD
jgi:hypothetical protein